MYTLQHLYRQLHHFPEHNNNYALCRVGRVTIKQVSTFACSINQGKQLLFSKGVTSYILAGTEYAKVPSNSVWYIIVPVQYEELE